MPNLLVVLDYQHLVLLVNQVDQAVLDYPDFLLYQDCQEFFLFRVFQEVLVQINLDYHQFHL